MGQSDMVVADALSGMVNGEVEHKGVPECSTLRNDISSTVLGRCKSASRWRNVGSAVDFKVTLKSLCPREGS